MEAFTSVLARWLPLPSERIGERCEYEVAGESSSVYWVPESRMKAPAKTTLFNRIQLSEGLKRDFSEDVIEYVFLHERGHANQDAKTRIKFAALSTGSFLLAFVLLVFTLVFAVMVVPELTLMRTVAAFGFLVATILVAWAHCGIKRDEELRAERYALDRLGHEKFLRRRRKWEQTVDRGVSARVQRRLFYPDEDTIISGR